MKNILLGVGMGALVGSWYTARRYKCKLATIKGASDALASIANGLGVVIEHQHDQIAKLNEALEERNEDLRNKIVELKEK